MGRECVLEFCRHALEARDYALLGQLMDRNFDLRRKIFGDRALGQANLRMIELARLHGGQFSFQLIAGIVSVLH